MKQDIKNNETTNHNQGRIIILLLLVISVTSWFAGFLTGKTNKEYFYTGVLTDTIIISTGNSDRTILPEDRSIEVKGRIVYSDGTPYINGMIEIRSEPRYTLTDGDGYFTFRNIEPGEHIISVIEGGSVISSTSVILERNTGTTGATLTKLKESDYVISVSLNVMLIEIQMEISGKNILINPGIRAVSDSEKAGSGVDIPTLIVSEGAAGSRQWTQASSINIFGSRTDGRISGSAVIAPGMSGRYVFNIYNPDSLSLGISLKLLESDSNNPRLPMEYRIGEGNYGGGYSGGNNWKRAGDITINSITLAAGEAKIFTLEWRWGESTDSIDTTIGMQKGEPLYYLSLVIDAEYQ